MSTSILKALPGKLDIKRHSPSILYLYIFFRMMYLSFAVVVALALKVTIADLVHGKFLTTVFAGFK